MQEFIRTLCFVDDHKGCSRASRICNYLNIFIIYNSGTVSKMVVAYVDRHGFAKVVELDRCKNL